METGIHILIVDDEPANQLILEDLLEKYYSVHILTNGRQALEYLREAGPGQVDLILLDVMMPEMDGFEACRRIKEDTQLKDVPVLFLTSLESSADEEMGLSLGAEDFIHKPFKPSVVLARIRNHLELALARRTLSAHNARLQELVEERTRDLFHEKQQVIAAQGATISALCTLAEVRDNETGNHIRRTQNYVRVLAEKLREQPRYAGELTDEVINLMYRSAPLHDIGKVAIPDAVLHKPGKLSDEEWVIMKRHAEFGLNALMQAEHEYGESVDMLQNVGKIGNAGLTRDEWAIMQKHTEYGRDALAKAEVELGPSGNYLTYGREIAYSHHEKWDGSGYPQGLSGEAIPLSARLMAVADVYDALISKRVYKEAWPSGKAIQTIVEGRGTHFDPNIVDAFIQVTDDFNAIAMDYRDE